MTERRTRRSGQPPDPASASAPPSAEPRLGPTTPSQAFGVSSWLIPSYLSVLSRDDGSVNLIWTNSPPHPRVEAAPELLDGFLRLELATQELIGAYARRWGPLWLCEGHDLPVRHDPDCKTYRFFQGVNKEELERASQPEEQGKFHFARAWFEEALDGWRSLASQMRATLRIARRLHDGLVADNRDWDALFFLREVLVDMIVPGLQERLATTEDHTNVSELEERSGLSFEATKAEVRLEFHDDASRRSRSPETEEQIAHEVFWESYFRLCEVIGRKTMQGSLDFQRQVLAAALNQWLVLAEVQPRLDWGAQNPQMQLGGDGLIGALAVQLFFACAQTGGLALCASCGTPFLPAGRRRRKDLNAYCSDCGLKAAMRDASARYRQTRKYRETNESWRKQRGVEENG